MKHGILLALLLVSGVSAQSVVRGPYLQQATPQSIIVKWRTSAATESAVVYVEQPGGSPQTIIVPGSRTDHEVLVTGLIPETDYGYGVGTSTGLLAFGIDYVFRTPPPVGSRRPVRAWVVGDSGTADSKARRVRDAYAAWVGDRRTDMMLMLGDNAYGSGTDSQYQSAVFDTYPLILRQTPVWATLGNHDASSTTTTPAESGPYYEIFSLPTAGEVGGQPSGTEGYYSFDHANVHYICLNSAQGGSAYMSTMATWLQADLTATAAEWIIAFWHHPPYTKGSHNSDSESGLITMRQTFLPILEAGGCDLVLCGHSHSYERSMLINGHYQDSSTFNPLTMALDAGDGAHLGDGAYVKSGVSGTPNEGSVYVVAGSSGKIGGGSLNHPAMIRNLNELGSCVLEIWGAQLDVLFLDEEGAICDTFSMTKAGATPVVSDHRRVAGRTCGARPINVGASWRYSDAGQDLGTSWRNPGFNDGGWSSGNAPLGFGESGLSTTVASGSASAVHPTTYLRRTFDLGADPLDVVTLRLLAEFDDGFVAYLNGTEVARVNMPAGPVTYSTLAASSVEYGPLELFNLDAHAGLLVPGKNVLAIEVHQGSAGSSDLWFDAQLWTGTDEQVWRYDDTGQDLGALWRDPAFNDSGWSAGPAPLGYGDVGLTEELSPGTVGATHPAAYFRKTFALSVPVQQLEALRLRIDYDDGFVAWLNGVEVARSASMPMGPVNFSTLAMVAREAGVVEVFDLAAFLPMLTPTGNVLAIEVHQWDLGSSDLALTAELDYDAGPVSWLSECAVGAIVDAAGEPESVLFLNGSDGGLGRSVNVASNAPVEIRLEAPSQGAGLHQYVVAVLLGTPSPADQILLPQDLGALCFLGISPSALVLFSNIAGIPGLLPTTALPLVTPIPAGIPGPIELTLQGLMTVQSGMFRTTNAVRLNVLP